MSAKRSYVVTRLEAIQQELELLKSSLEGEPKAIKLEGLWKGTEITEEDIEAAKRSLFKGERAYGGNEP
jgi:hypothetical protein